MIKNTDSALLRVTRLRDGITGALLPFRILVDGRVVGRVKRGEVVEIVIPPGEHRVQVTQSGVSSREWGLDVGPGEVGSFVCRPAGRLLQSFRHRDEWLCLEPDE